MVGLRGRFSIKDLTISNFRERRKDAGEGRVIILYMLGEGGRAAVKDTTNTPQTTGRRGNTALNSKYSESTLLCKYFIINHQVSSSFPVPLVQAEDTPIFTNALPPNYNFSRP